MGSILLVETDPDTSERWTRALGAGGHAVIVASKLRDTLASVKDGGIDLIVIDAHDSMAGIVELARSIDLVPDAPPLVLVSSSPAAPEISVRIRAASFLPKPCEASELIHVVDRLLGQLRPVRVLAESPSDPDGEPDGEVSFDDQPTGTSRLY